ncbi:methyl-accepting chemotaxis protein [Sphingosinicella sp. BN140058]|uniref:methyl-accepting chemotaxis protein n=1 Tax=Sphingosinicella sp. BN140058 TaxID=1892855 RepID=UPI001011C8CE|nr:methyl-accepting chemotaxis protein [Sphingosinicella sp. BN140058]QAY77557.1 chemotaxis protein [Sphingosinicella sp. BN140058]
MTANVVPIDRRRNESVETVEPPTIASLVSARESVAASAPLIEAVERFRTAPVLRLIAVLDECGRPVGAIFEREMRTILFNPYGYALLKNPSFGGSLAAHIRPYPTIEAEAPLDALLEVHARHDARVEGVIVTRAGHFVGIVTDEALLRIAAARQVEVALQRARRAERIEQASAEFQTDAGRLGTDLSDLSGSLGEAAARMIVRAAANREAAVGVAGASTQAAANMDEVARRAHALAGSLHRVEARSGAASAAARDAVALAERGGDRMRRLAGSAEEIVDVTELIDDIARRTRMLAINASIEAARAGEAGRGFTIVAGEVKALAAQTRNAAATIKDRVQQIGTAIGDVAEGQSGIEAVIHAAEAVSASLHDAMQEQRLATQEIARNLEEAGKATEEIERNAARINASAAAAADAAGSMQDIAAGLSDQGQRVGRRLGEFLDVVRTA